VKPFFFMYATQFAQQPHVGLLYTVIFVATRVRAPPRANAVVAADANAS
jgi:hypothetical protein